MFANLKNSVLSVLALAMLVAVGLQAFIADRVILLRDQQAESLEVYSHIRGLDRLLSEARTLLAVNERPAEQWLESFDALYAELGCCEPEGTALINAVSAPATAPREMLVAIEQLQAAIGDYLKERDELVADLANQNKLLPWLSMFMLLLIVLGAWMLLRQIVLLPISLLLDQVRTAAMGKDVKFSPPATTPIEVAELGKSFEVVVHQLREELDSRDYALRLARETARAESEKTASELAELVDGSSSAIFTLGLDGRVKTWNRKIAALTGVPSQVAIGSPFEMRFLSGSYRIQFHDAFQGALDGQSIDGLRIPLLSEAHVAVDLLLSVAPQKNRDGSIGGVTAFGHPVGDFLEQTARQVEQLRVSHFNELATGAAHQFNQPLQNMRLYLANALNRLRSDEIDRVVLTKKLRGVDEQLTRMSDIVDHLREFGRSSPPVPGGFDLLTVIERCVELNRGVFTERGIRLTLESGIQDERAAGHPLQIEKALIAVLDNAREAMAESDQEQPVVVVSLNNINGKQVALVVKDNAGGVDDEVLSRVFDPFFTTRVNTRNVGLGLSSARAAIEGIGGEIGIGSVRDTTTVTIVIPLHIGEQHGG